MNTSKFFSSLKHKNDTWWLSAVDAYHKPYLFLSLMCDTCFIIPQPTKKNKFTSRCPFPYILYTCIYDIYTMPINMEYTER